MCTSELSFTSSFYYSMILGNMLVKLYYFIMFSFLPNYTYFSSFLSGIKDFDIWRDKIRKKKYIWFYLQKETFQRNKKQSQPFLFWCKSWILFDEENVKQILFLIFLENSIAYILPHFYSFKSIIQWKPEKIWNRKTTFRLNLWLWINIWTVYVYIFIRFWCLYFCLSICLNPINVKCTNLTSGLWCLNICNLTLICQTMNSVGSHNLSFKGLQRLGIRHLNLLQALSSALSLKYCDFRKFKKPMLIVPYC